MQAFRLSENERAATGFTHRFIITRTSATVADWTSGTALTLATLVTGSVVSRVLTRYVVGSDATTSATMSVGDTSSSVQFIASTACTATSSPTVTLAAASTNKAYTAANSLQALVTETGVKTLGEFHVYAHIVDTTSLDTGASV